MLLNMKKILIIIPILIILSLGGWILFRKIGAPMEETTSTESPFGSPNEQGEEMLTNDNPPLASIGTTTAEEIISQNKKLFRLSDLPVAGAVVITRSTGSGKASTTTFVRYVERATGHIYEVDLSNLEKVKIVNQTLPKIYEAYFRPDGNAVLYRYLKNDSDTVENLSLSLNIQASSTKLYTTNSTMLRGDISSVAVGTGN